MCFTFIGRLHTRLALLVVPLLFTGMIVLLTGERAYFTLFGLMAVSGLALELGVYSWLIQYQPRWLTILLAVPEFLLVWWLMALFGPALAGVSNRQAIGLFAAAWLINWLTLQIVLPLLWPRWAEDSGEFRS